MRTSLMRWLLQRGKPKSYRWGEMQRRCGYRAGWQENTWDVLAKDKYLERAMRSAVFTGRETANITQIIYQGKTQAYVWDDVRRTWTMPTMKLVKR